MIRTKPGRWPLTVSVTLVLALAACGPAPAPRVVRVTPAGGAAGARLDRPIVVEFSSPLDPASIHPGAVELTAGGAALAHTVELDGGGTRLLVRITEQPEALPATVEARLLGALRGRNGRSVEPYAWSFELGDWIPLGGALNRDPANNVRSLSPAWWDGPAVVWGEADDPDENNFTVYTARWDDAAGVWQPLGERLDLGPTSWCNYPSAAVLSGEFWAAMQCSVRGRMRVYAARWNGDAWELSGPLNHDAGRFGYTPELAAGDRLYALWREWDAQANTYTLVWSSYQTGWTPGSPDLASGTDLSLWSFAASGQEMAAAYHDNNGPGGVLVYRYDGQAWQQLGPGALEADGQANTPSQHARLAFTPAGQLWAAWDEGSRSYAAHWDGHAWQMLAEPAGGGSGQVSYTYDLDAADGSPCVLLTEGADQDLYVRCWSGAAWRGYGGPIVKDPEDAELQSGEAGWPLVAWRAEEEGVWRLHVAYYNHVAP